MNQFNGDEEILLEMISIFQDTWPDLLDPIRDSIENKDADKLRLNAHTFKGVLSNFFAEDGTMLAYELELRGEHAKFEDSWVLLNRLEDQLTLFLYEIISLKKTLLKSP